jgi:Sulfite reductase, beta subunit (hemoprotein)
MTRDATSSSITLLSADVSQMSKVERLKAASEGLFFVADGKPRPFAAELDALSTGEAETISDAAKEISKHFGIYKQRERNESGGKTGDFIFMVRLKLPAGGELSPAQWVALDEAADRFADGTLRLTARQGVQFHFVYGAKLGPLVRHLNAEYRDRGYRMTTLGACGDVNRNTMCSPIDDLDAELPLDSRSLAHAIAAELAPRSSAYYQIFLTNDESRTIAPVMCDEPIYGRHYLPRKFKVGIAHPHDNSIDLLTQDVGLLPVVRDGQADEYDLYAGGGLGITHNQPNTKQLLGLYLGRIPHHQVVDTVRAIAILQKEHGERKDRRQARWKYTIRRLRVTRVKRVLRERFNIDLRDADSEPLPPVRYWHGWHREAGGGDRWYLGIPVESGRLRDSTNVRLRSAVREIVKALDLGVRVTPNQDLLLCHIPEQRRGWVEVMLARHGVKSAEETSRLRRLALACPAKPTCGLAMSEAERLLPELVGMLEQQGLGEVDVIIRMAGCPNSCSRPPTAEIGIYGYGKNDFVVQVGGSREGTRIGKVLYKRVTRDELTTILVGLVRSIRDHNPERLSAGDYLHRLSIKTLRRLAEHRPMRSQPKQRRCGAVASACQ